MKNKKMSFTSREETLGWAISTLLMDEAEKFVITEPAYGYGLSFPYLLSRFHLLHSIKEDITAIHSSNILFCVM